MKDPLQITFRMGEVNEHGSIKLGKITASDDESKDWHEFNLFLTNRSAKTTLYDIKLNTNLAKEDIKAELPKSLSPTESNNVKILIRASKLLDTELESPYISIDYQESRTI